VLRKKANWQFSVASFFDYRSLDQFSADIKSPPFDLLPHNNLFETKTSSSTSRSSIHCNTSHPLQNLNTYSTNSTIKMFSRQVVRAARASRFVAPTATRVNRAAFTAGTRLREPVSDVVAAGEVSAATYTDGHIERSTIKIDQTGIEGAPLNKAVFNQLPRTMQKLSLMDKVVVVTG
jgi:hypothetical protein